MTGKGITFVGYELNHFKWSLWALGPALCQTHHIYNTVLWYRILKYVLFILK